ncbi:MAG: hypothetical protein AAFZ15_33960 [Bacteroidota bacterium]
MDYLKDRTFELFRYTIPGVFMILVCLMLDSRVNTPFDLYEIHLQGASTSSVLFAMFFGYIAGLIIDEMALYLIRKFFRKKLKPVYASSTNLTLPQKYALLREKSVANYKNIENHIVISGMCRNLSLGFLFLSVVAAVKLFLFDDLNVWLSMLLVALLSMVCLYVKSRKFLQWWLQDMDAAVDFIEDNKEGEHTR